MKRILLAFAFAGGIGGAFASYLAPNEPGYRLETVNGTPTCVEKRPDCNINGIPPCTFSGLQLYRKTGPQQCATIALKLP